VEQKSAQELIDFKSHGPLLEEQVVNEPLVLQCERGQFPSSVQSTY
jgi:hypothetical protein